MDNTKPEHFTKSSHSICYYHALDASRASLEEAESKGVIFEFDLSWAYSAFRPEVKEQSPYIGHPEEFYLMKGKVFPNKNLSYDEVKIFIKAHPNMKVLIDIKDVKTLPTLEDFICEVGSHRCIVHAFVNPWSPIPAHIEHQPHWNTETISITELNAVLSKYDVPLIANCRMFPHSDINPEDHLERILQESKQYSTLYAIGFYYKGAPIPNFHLLKKINDAGYFAWINGNQKDYKEKTAGIEYIAMCDNIEKCTKY